MLWLKKHPDAGVMRGAGRQLLASILNLITYWVLGLPLAILLGVILHYGVEGLWVALCITTSVQVRPSCACLGCSVFYMLLSDL